MGIEYCHYVIPVPAAMRPEPAHLASLIGRLRRDKFIPDHAPELLQPHGESSPVVHLEPWILSEWMRDDMILRWYVERADGSGCLYPLEPKSEVPHDPYWQIEIRSSPEFVHRASEIIEPLSSTRCRCGQELEFSREEGRDIFYSFRIRRVCPRCGAEFVPDGVKCLYHDGWTARVSDLKGGCVHGFALLVDCGKCHPHAPWQPRISAALRACLIEELHCEFREVGDYS
ncbi:MAG: hypothetical protein IT452_22425 [Planctomycetia bacterium]|nr:hypothetical protein [Planctomycetia bacterium]